MPPLQKVQTTSPVKPHFSILYFVQSFYFILFYFNFFCQPSNKRRAVICTPFIHTTWNVDIYIHKLWTFMNVDFYNLWTLWMYVSMSTLCGVCISQCATIFTYKRMGWYVLLSIFLCLPLSTQPNLVYFGWIPTPQSSRPSNPAFFSFSFYFFYVKVV